MNPKKEAAEKSHCTQGCCSGNTKSRPNSTRWNWQDLDGEAAYDRFGWKTALSYDGNIVAVSSYYNSGNGATSGHVRVYEWNGSSWIQKGVDIDGEAAGDESGRNISLNSNGNIIAIGASGNDGGGIDAGHVRVYEWNGSSWVQKGQDINGDAAYDECTTVDIDSFSTY